MSSRSKKIAIFLPNLCSGGAERITVHLANGLVERGYAVDMVLIRAEGPFLSDLAPDVRVVDLNKRRVLQAIPCLAAYLRAKRPAVLISALDHVNVAAILARFLSRTETRVIAAVHVTHSMDAKHKHGIKQRILRVSINRCYRRADAIVCVSQGVADDLIRVTHVSRKQVHVIYNPVITPRIEELSREPVLDPWFADGEPPVILAIGSLTPPKDFATLLRAFALVRETHDVRLVILGEGPERNRLENLAKELRLEPWVALPGFSKNPYARMARATLFVLSSAWEALPTVLIEALAVGVPVVSTDCDSGPREILRGGELGHLVPVGNTAALAHAISESLSGSHPSVPVATLLPYTLDFAVNRYCQLITELTGA